MCLSSREPAKVFELIPCRMIRTACSLMPKGFNIFTTNVHTAVFLLASTAYQRPDNPTSDVAGNQHWGHATSTDGYTWVNQPIAIFPPNNDTFVYTGSAVVDVNNTSGFFPDQNNGVVAIFTLAYIPEAGSGEQTQNIAYSRDGGYTFENYEGNPVISIGSDQFRDPKVKNPHLTC